MVSLQSVFTGIQTGTREVAAAAKSLYDMDSFDKWTKAAGSQLRVLNLLTGGYFNECLKTVEAQKDLYLATAIFSSLGEWIATDQNGVRSLQTPKKRGTQDTDWIKVCYTIGNIFETGKFLQKYAIVSFPNCSRFAAAYGSIPLFSFKGENWTVANIPWINTFSDKPKEFFVVIAASLEIRNYVWAPNNAWNPNFWDTVNLLKLVNSTGKIVMICFAGPLLRKHLFLAVTIMDFVTTHTGLFAHILKKRRDRLDRYGI